MSGIKEYEQMTLEEYEALWQDKEQPAARSDQEIVDEFMKRDASDELIYYIQDPDFAGEFKVPHPDDDMSEHTLYVYKGYGQFEPANPFRRSPYIPTSEPLEGNEEAIEVYFNEETNEVEISGPLVHTGEPDVEDDAAFYKRMYEQACVELFEARGLLPKNREADEVPAGAAGWYDGSRRGTFDVESGLFMRKDDYPADDDPRLSFADVFADIPGLPVEEHLGQPTESPSDRVNPYEESLANLLRFLGTSPTNGEIEAYLKGAESTRAVWDR